MGADFSFCFLTTIIDMSFYLGSKILFFLINLIIFAPLIIATVVLLLKKRKKQCITAGFLYLIGGVLIWLIKLIYFIYLLLTNEVEESFKVNYGKYFFIISFLLNVTVVFFRLGATYLTKAMFADVCLLEEYIHEKEHAELIQSLANRNDDDKLCEDDDINEDETHKKNPFITGRGKKGDNEEVEINFESTL
jgi:hypothetical protein